MRSDFKITRFSFYTLVCLISFFVMVFPPINTFSYDVFGYYMYLPLTFKYHDVTIQNYSIITDTLNTYHASETFYQAVKWDNGNWVMRYPIGLSVLFAPFYFIADVIAGFTNYPKDGFSRPYQLSVLYGCLFYTMTGLYFVKRILTQFFDDKTSAITLICIALGTNYFFHVAMHGQGTMSHNLLFSLYAVIIYFTIKWHHTYKPKYLMILGFCVGLTALCRPSEIISILIPCLYGITNSESLKANIKLFLKLKIQIIAFILVIVCVGFLQFAYWKYASGKFIINPYGSGNPGEGLELLHPHILEVLFSFRKGWFIYTPIMVFTVIGFWYLYQNNKKLFTPIFIYFLINLYIVSSWSCWWYGACFGVRSLIPSYAALSIPLAYFIAAVLKHNIRYVFMSLLVVCVALNLFQSWQMYTGIMDSTNMSRAYYTSTFLQTSPPTQEQRKLLLTGKFSDGLEVFKPEDSLTHMLNYAKLINFENADDAVNPKFLSQTVHRSGIHSLMINSDNPGSPFIEVMYKAISSKSYSWLKASAWVYSEYPADSLDAVFSISMEHKNYTFKEKKYPLSTANFKPNAWTKLEYYYLVPDDLRSKKDEVKLFITNKSKYILYVDDLLLESYEPVVDKSVF